MRKNRAFAFCLIFAAVISVHAQRAWQQITDPRTKELAANFKTPPPQYGMILWWGWDGPMSDTDLLFNRPNGLSITRWSEELTLFRSCLCLH